MSLLQWEDHIDFGKNFGQRWPLINRSDKKNDDCGICAAPYQDIPCTVLIFRASQMALRRQVWPPVGRGLLVSGIRRLHAAPR